MRIAIDARWIFPEISGIGAHTQELLRYLALVDRRNSYVLLFSDRKLAERTWAEAQLSTTSNFRPEIIPWSIFSPRGQWMLPRHLQRLRIDVFHSTNYMIPLAAFPRGKPGRLRCVVTIHDLIPMIFPHATPNALKTRLFPIYKRLMMEVGLRADRIITVSEASRQDVLRHLQIAPSRHSSVSVIYNGVSESFQPAKTDTIPRSPEKIILYVGRRDPYKNLVNLLDAFALARKQCPVPLRLKLIGPADPRYPQAEEKIRQLDIGYCVDQVGYQSLKELVHAYQTASLTVLPSRYEGFGFPVVESMACGTPVVCSDIPVLREVAGDAALYAAPDDIPAMSAALCRAATDGGLRTELARKGLARSALFSWKENAIRTVQLYDQVGSNAPMKEASS